MIEQQPMESPDALPIVFNLQRQRIQETILFLIDKTGSIKADAERTPLNLSPADMNALKQDLQSALNSLAQAHRRLQTKV